MPPPVSNQPRTLALVVALACAPMLGACGKEAPDAPPPAAATASAGAADLARDAAAVAGDAVEVAGDVAGAAGDAAASAADAFNAAATAAAGAEAAADAGAAVVGDAFALAGRVLSDGLPALEAPLGTWRATLADGLDRLDEAAADLAADPERMKDAAWRAKVEAALGTLRNTAGEMAVAGQAASGRPDGAVVGGLLAEAGSRVAALAANVENALAAGDADTLRAVIGAAATARDATTRALDALEAAVR